MFKIASNTLQKPSLYSWFWDELYLNSPYAPFASNNKHCGIQMPRRKAFESDYVQINPPCNIKWFVIDVDEDVTNINFEALPPPNALVKNKNNNKGHLLYRVDDILIQSVQEKIEVRKKPIQFAKAVYYGMCKAIPGADKAAFNNKVTKNPFSSSYELSVFHSRQYSLSDLAKEIKPDWSVYKVGNRNNPNPESRHLTLFHSVRHQAYSLVDKYRINNDLEGFYIAVKELCNRNNEFRGEGFKDDSNLDSSSVNAIAKSIAEWTFNNYNGERINRGVMKLPFDMELSEKQKLSAKRTAQNRKSKSLNALLEAWPKRNTLNKPSVLKKWLSQETGLSLATVRRYWEKVVGSNEEAIKNTFQSFGVNKVSFPRAPRDLKNGLVSTSSFSYELSGFRLRGLLDLRGKEKLKLTSFYYLNDQMTRLSERSDLNIQLMSSDLRKRVFKGWNECDLVFSHGQMLNSYIQEKYSLLSDVFNQTGCSLLEPLKGFIYFNNNMRSCFSSWSRIAKLSEKSIKVGLVALIHGAGDALVDEKLEYKLDLLKSNLEFIEVYQAIKLIRRYEPNLSDILRAKEVNLLRPLWGKGLMLHDGVLVKDEKLIQKLNKNYFWKWSTL